MIKYLLLLLLSITLSTSLPPQAPVIGIYTQDRPGQNYTYIAASYVKYLEMSGAQVVPLFYTYTQQELKTILEQINGVLFPGGAMEINIANTWTKNANFIFEFAKSENQQGRVFPIWATCLGHQLVSYLTCGFDSKAIQPVDGQSPIVNTLSILTPNTSIFKNFQPQHFTAASTGHGVCYFSHHYAIYTKYFNQSKQLSNFWHLVATTTSPSNQQFVSLQQAKNYPFYSSQFHPEKSPFEWHLDANRTKESIEIVQLLSNNFVEQARLSGRRWRDQAERERAVIYNYEVTYLVGDESFQQVYKFKK